MRNQQRKHIALILLLIFYAVGIVGIARESSRELFVSLSAFNLLLTLFLYAWGSQQNMLTWLYPFASAFTFGLIVEMVGVETGMLFGKYHYGDGLGPKVLQVPWIIGVNWFLLTASCLGVLASLIRNKWILMVFAALCTVVLDYIIEPVAINLDYWSWDYVDVPFRNYVMWFISAFLIQWFYKQLDFRPDQKMSLGVLLSQLLFFGILHVAL